MSKTKGHTHSDEMTNAVLRCPWEAPRKYRTRRATEWNDEKTCSQEPSGQMSSCPTSPSETSWRGETRITTLIFGYPSPCLQMSQQNLMVHVNKGCWQIYNNQHGNLTSVFCQEEIIDQLSQCSLCTLPRLKGRLKRVVEVKDARWHNSCLT